MFKIREALSGDDRGDQSRLADMRCVDDGTISRWRRAIELMNATEGKVEI
jgi:hypothetical protein